MGNSPLLVRCSKPFEGGLEEKPSREVAHERLGTPPRQRTTAQEFFAKNKMAVVPQAPYSPHLAPCYIFLFPKMKIMLKGRRSDTVEEIHAETQTVLNILTKKDFQDAFQKWQSALPWGLL
jgi:hypothetical protein